LYFFKSDTPATATAAPVSACIAACLTTWPIYYGTPVSVPLGLLASDFGSFDRGSGVLQSTYKGWPLYTYAPDIAVGNVLGEGVGSRWYTAKSPFVVP
jgi:predicted lipoprotein with Yx(FWY)xxD motif